MAEHSYSDDYDDAVLAELYDQSETGTDDLSLLRQLIAGRGPLRIVEPFSGTGRLLVPLAADGHDVTGIEIAPAMAERALAKIASLDFATVRARVLVRDALAGSWGRGFDLVVLGGNCLYELPDAERQRACFSLAFEALRSGGHLFVDNDDYKGGWEDGPVGRERTVFAGTTTAGALGRASAVDLRFDPAERILHMRRILVVRTAAGLERRRELLTRKRPVSATEVAAWLAASGFEALETFGDREGTPYSSASVRAVFWAKKPDA